MARHSYYKQAIARESVVYAEAVHRREDPRLLTGRGQYVSDLQAPGMLAAAILRSPHAHARIVSVDLEAARACPGVVLALSGADLAELPAMPDASGNVTPRWLNRVQPRLQWPRQRALALNEVHYAGESVAVVVARDRYAAEDALDAIHVEYEPLPVSGDPVAAAEAHAPTAHSDLADNLLFEFGVGKGAAPQAFATAPHTIRQRFRSRRNAAVPMEGRGALAVPDVRTGALTLYTGCQQPHLLRRVLAATFGLSESLVRLIVPDVGGGFGGKNGAYPEDVLISYLARRLGRPVKWVEDRRENLLAMNQGRDQVVEAAVAFDGDGRVLAVELQQWLDSGAYQPMGPVVPYQTATHLLGPYAIPNMYFHGRAVATNKPPNAPYRGAGRPEATFFMETLMDLVARELELDPAEVRRRNLIGPESMPYNVSVPFRDGADIEYDSGDYPELLRQALAEADYDELRRRQAELRGQGRLLGIGIACYVEATGTGPFEGASIAVDGSGGLVLTTGACSQGQGHETSLAEIAGELWGVPPERVKVLLGDTGRMPFGAGTYASRTLQLVSAALVDASRQLQDKLRAVAARLLEASPEDMELDMERRLLAVRGDPSRSVTLAQAVMATGPGWGRSAEGEPGPQSTAYYAPERQEWASAAHLAVVEIEPDTGDVAIQRYVVCHDAGHVVSPVLADGQVVGGVITGLGGALLEEHVYDPSGQPLSTSLMDYLIPGAVEMPDVTVLHVETHTPVHPLNIKGLGEGGTVGAPAAIAGAISDALAPFGLTVADLPVSPERLVFPLLAGEG
ncbi:MAG TPA: xanthine dehydrogenase family protein molybdopterin-binding subunit [Chloroflexota bacterium]|nr:xanthine dehydrogenase family protein molybdopterin-binding subunit [Chloroflexota bacterium]